MVLNEITNFAKSNMKECLMLKVDFEKTYECVSWNFLRYLLKRMGFRNKWCIWMEALVFTSTISMIVTGSLTAEFVVSRGLRQGDPMSLLFFILVPEGLEGLMRNATEYEGLHGFRFNENIHFELLQFANDTIMICDGSLDNLWCLKAVFRGFERVFGLSINFNKSKVYGINIGDNILATASNFLPCDIGSLAFLFP